MNAQFYTKPSPWRRPQSALDRPAERLPGKEYALFRLEIALPSKTVSTGYGVRWPTVPHDLAYYGKIARATGFEVVKSAVYDRWFSLELRKP